MSLHESDDIVQSKQHIGGIFGRAALTYDQVGPPFFPHFGKRLVDIAKISPGSKVLDVATGRGALLFPAAEAVGQYGQVVGIDLAETMAIGDNYNDVSMFAKAGRSVAMGNANYEIKSLCDVITDTNEESGVAKAILEVI